MASFAARLAVIVGLALYATCKYEHTKSKSGDCKSTSSVCHTSVAMNFVKQYSNPFCEAIQQPFKYQYAELSNTNRYEYYKISEH